MNFRLKDKSHRWELLNSLSKKIRADLLKESLIFVLWRVVIQVNKFIIVKNINEHIYHCIISENQIYTVIYVRLSMTLLLIVHIFWITIITKMNKNQSRIWKTDIKLYIYCIKLCKLIPWSFSFFLFLLELHLLNVNWFHLLAESN